jgi:hypothetical protein
MLAALLDAPAQVLHAPGELVAQLLQLLEAEQAGAGGGGCERSGAEVRKAVGHDRRHLPLESRHLLAQRPAGRALAELARALKDVAGYSVAVDRCLRGLAHAHSFTCQTDGFYQRAWRR